MAKQRNRPHHHGHEQRRSGQLQLPRYQFNPLRWPSYVLPRGWVARPNTSTPLASSIVWLCLIGAAIVLLVGILLALGMLFGGR